MIVLPGKAEDIERLKRDRRGLQETFRAAVGRHHAAAGLRLVLNGPRSTSMRPIGHRRFVGGLRGSSLHPNYPVHHRLNRTQGARHGAGEVRALDQDDLEVVSDPSAGCLVKVADVHLAARRKSG